MNKLLLKNGLKIYIDDLANTHSFAIDLCVRAGSKYESKEENGITHFLEHMHFRKLNNYTQNELYHYMESLGTSLMATTYKDFLRFYMKVHYKYFEKSLKIFASLLETDYWEESEIEKEKAVVLSEIREHSDSDIDDVFDNSYFFGSTLSNCILGTEHTVKMFNEQQLSDYKSRIFNTNNMALFISGPIKESHLSCLEHILGQINIPNGDRWYTNQKPKDFGKRKNNIVIENADWDFVDVDISFDIDIDKISLTEAEVLNCILGGGVGSRLQMILREDMGLVYDISSFVEMYEELAVLRIQYSIPSDLFYSSYKAVINVLDCLKESINIRDLESTLPFYTDNLQFNLDDTQENNFFNEHNRFVLNTDSCISLLDYNEATIRRLSDIAKDLFIKQNLTVVCLGGCDNIKKKKIADIANLLNL